MPLPPLPDPPGLRPLLRTTFVSLPATGVLGSTLLGANSLQLLSLGLRPFSLPAFRRVNREIADTWWGFCVVLSRWMNGAELQLTGDTIPPRENAVVVVNHQQMPDITFLMLLARDRGRLGDMKWFVKDKLKYAPGVGWGMLFLDCLFVKRDWAEDEASIRRTFASLKQGQVPLWLLLFPEGTRLSPAKLEKSRSYAQKQGLRPPEHLLLPRTKGFVASVQGLQGHIDAVYDITIGYKQGVPTLWQYVKGLSPRAHMHLHRVPAAELPNDEEGLRRWLLQRFELKDRLLAHFYRHGAFPRTDGELAGEEP